ncbi:MAG: hypothetical protein HYW70_00480 [Candidatus Nealsonbacteria bacterium]|nr:hypothetical protein [Candidatus Nealsonbacteria bacterium]
MEKKSVPKDRGRLKPDPAYVSLAELAKNSPYSQEYLSLLARRGKLQAKKFGRNWYAAREALDGYLAHQGLNIVLPKHLFNASYKGKITKPFDALSFEGQIRNGEVEPNVILTQFGDPQEPIDLGGTRERWAERIKEKEQVSEPVKPEEKAKEELKSEEILKIEPYRIRTMRKDIMALTGGGVPKKEYKAQKPETTPKVVSKEPVRPEQIPLPIGGAAKKIIPEKEVLATERKQAPEKEETIKEMPIEDRVLDKLLQALEARIPPRGPFEKLAQINGAANHYFRSSFKVLAVSVVAIVVMFLLIGGVSFGNVDKMMLAVNSFLKDATTLRGHFAGTHANEVLLLDKEGKISIYGHVETRGQLRSFVEQGVAPLVVDSTTTVENLSADYLDNLSSKDFTLAFVTKNGNITYEDVKLEGNVEVGKTLVVKGAAKLLDSLFVYGTIGTFGDIIGKGNLTIGGAAKLVGPLLALGGVETKGANLNLGSGTISTTNRNLVQNLNADMVDSMNADDFTLDFVTSNGANTFNTISVSGINVNKHLAVYGTFLLGDERLVGAVDTKYWDISATGNINTEGTLIVKGNSTFRGEPGAAIASATSYINPSSAPSNTILLGVAVNGSEKLRIDAEGDLTAQGSITASGALTVSGATTFNSDVTLASPADLILNAGSLTVNALSAPSGVSAQATTTGSLASGTYYYVVTSLNSNGETSSSTEVSAAVDGSTTTAVNISWSSVTSATSYRVYGRTQGAQDRYWQTTSASFKDTGTAGTAAAVPSSNSTGGSGTFYSGLTVLGTTISRSIVPQSAAFYNLGSPGLWWDNIYVSAILATSTVFLGNATTTNIYPSADISYFLGSPSFRWANTYSVTTTIGGAGGAITIDNDDIRASSGLTVSSTEIMFSASTGKLSATSSQDIYFATAGAERFRIGSSGQVTISGNVDATSGLDVTGAKLTATTTEITATDAANVLTITQRGLGRIALATSTSSMTSSAFQITNLGSGNSFLVEDADTDASPFVIDASGKVGIASSTPTAALEVGGNIYTTGDITLSGNLLPSTPRNKDIGSVAVDWQNVYAQNVYADNILATTSTLAGTQGETWTINTDAASDATSTLRFYRGTDAPHALLAWDAGYDRFSFNFPFFVNNSATSTFAGPIAQNSGNMTIGSAIGNLLLNPYGGNVGIGTTTPSSLLEIWTSTAGINLLEIGTSTASNLFVVDSSGRLVFGGDTNLYRSSANVLKTDDGFIAFASSTIVGDFSAGASGVPTLFVDDGGNVGIASSTPSATLSIQGNVISSGNFTFYGSGTNTFSGQIYFIRSIHHHRQSLLRRIYWHRRQLS